MTVNEVTLQEFFNLPKQMVISTSQRNYDWNEERLQKLWDDVLRIAKDESVTSHSLGTIICIEHGILPKSHIPRFLLLDGRQRLVTISLLLTALNNTDKRPEGEKANSLFGKIYDLLLFNPGEAGELEYKIMVEGTDFKLFQALLKGKKGSPASDNWFSSTLEYFEQIACAQHVDPDLFGKGLAKLAVTPVSTDQYYEEPTKVYDNIMATGLDDVQTSLIRNWLKLLSSS